MSTIQPPVSDMLVTVKSREMQRGLLASMSGHPEEAIQHFLAAAHLELVLAQDYEQAGEPGLARRSRISAASCFWKAGLQADAERIMDEMLQANPTLKSELEDVLNDLKQQNLKTN